MPDSAGFRPPDIAGYLAELKRRLDARGITGRMRVVGGAALAALYPEDPDVRVTRDIDAMYWPKEGVDVVVNELAAEHGLSKGWLNDRARPFAPVDVNTTDAESFEVGIADPRELLAMKLAASREQDLNDLEILVRHLGIEVAEQIVDIAFDYYGTDSLVLNESRSDYLLIAQQVLNSAKHRRKRLR